VERAQRLSRDDTLSHSSWYLEVSVGASSVAASSPADTPPDPDAAPAGATENADRPASMATAAISGRTILSLGFAAVCEEFNFTALSSLTGLADGLAPKSRRYTANQAAIRPNEWVPRRPAI
jgi:hypothetical protein